MKSLLITGGAGFIGANFAHRWCRSKPGDRLVILDKLTYAGHYASVLSLCKAGNVRFVRGDIRDFDLVVDLLKSEHIDAIVHFAAESHVDRSIVGPAVFVETNVIGTQVLLDAAREVWLSGSGRPHRFHHVSTDEVYGSLGPQDAPFTENHPYDPRSPYAASKAAADHIVRAYGHTYGIDYSISNCSNNYGPYQFPEKLIPLCILNALQGNPLPIYGDGSNVRDWLHVEDHCRALELIVERSPSQQTWNIGADNERSNVDLIQQLCAVIDEAFRQNAALAQRFPACPAANNARTHELIAFVKDRPGHDRRYAIDASRLSQTLNFRAHIPLQRGLEQTLQWYLDNEEWWRSILSGEYADWVRTHYELAQPAPASRPIT